MGMTPEIRNGIFKGESGGDMNALFGFSNRDGGQFSNVRLTDMTVDQALEFSKPSGPYAQWVKGQVGRVATPMGGYQIVGTTLRAAKKALGLSGSEVMTDDLQHRLGDWIYAAQGTGAWEGYAGPSNDPIAPIVGQRGGGEASRPATDQNPARLAYAYANGRMTPEDAALYERGVQDGYFPAVQKRKDVNIPKTGELETYAVATQRRKPPMIFQPTQALIATNATPLTNMPGLKGFS